ncbi:vancomycin resistance protein [Brevibacillus laterosporus]|nr:VanW family protein [Brevibacillus laterosporus]TPG70869.1 vancomycin resistance protein [Brevibacillus laterosporus]TPG75219.1 vancomycin resistance protein [Brevibacillus laterosporus]
MKQIPSLRPKIRSRLRIWLGTTYYRLRRYGEWYLSDTRFALKKSPELLPVPVFSHQTPLLRKLKNVDMWLQHNKIHNLRLAIQSLDGVLIQPGETFSYWRLLKKPTKKRGYVDGMQLFYGQVKLGVGGGLCQLSNLIYWMTLHTPLKVTERYRHSYDVFPDSNRTQPFGSGATCAYNYMDLRIKNETKHSYQLHLYMTEDTLVGEWRTLYPHPYVYEIYERSHEIQPAYWGGYTRHNELYRRVYTLDGTLTDDFFIAENHALMMYEPLLPPAKNPTPEEADGS